jgi:hypothetical protein
LLHTNAPTAIHQRTSAPTRQHLNTSTQSPTYRHTNTPTHQRTEHAWTLVRPRAQQGVECGSTDFQQKLNRFYGSSTRAFSLLLLTVAKILVKVKRTDAR